jgi:hypothetical protein
MTDRRFDVIKFGGGSLFGPSDDSGSHFLWGVEVDWDQDGAFTGENEASRMTGLNIRRGRTSYVRPQGQGFQPVATGRARVELDNSDGRYDGFNSDSPLYPSDIKIQVKDIDTGTIYPVFYGTISDIKTKGYGHNARVTIYADDGYYFLREYTARVATSTDVAPEDAIGSILDYINWPSRWGRDLDITTDNIKYFWASGNKLASNIIENIVESFPGYFFMAADGKATYTARTNVDTIGVEYSESDYLKDIGLPQPYENNRNTTRIKSYPRTESGDTVIWQLLGDTPSVQPGSDNAEILFADYTYNDIAVPALSVNISSSDYTMNTQPDGSGVDTSSDFTVDLVDFGDTARLTFTNSGSGTSYITSVQIKGSAVFLQNNADVVYPSSTSDLTQVRELFLDLIWQQDINVATDFSTLVGSFMEDLHPYPTIQLENRAEKQFKPDLFDIVTLNMPTLGLSGESYRVAGIEHQSMNENCQAMKTIFFLEAYISFENFWTFDIADFGTDTRFGA